MPQATATGDEEPQVPSVELPKTLNLKVFLSDQSTLVVAMFLVAMMTLAAGLTYYQVATVTKCHADKFLGIKIGETCVTKRKF